MQVVWFKDRYDDFKFWLRSRPFRRFSRAVKDRIDAFVFCFLLMIVGIYSPRQLRILMLDALREKK